MRAPSIPSRPATAVSAEPHQKRLPQGPSLVARARLTETLFSSSRLRSASSPSIGRTVSKRVTSDGPGEDAGAGTAVRSAPSISSPRDSNSLTFPAGTCRGRTCWDLDPFLGLAK